MDATSPPPPPAPAEADGAKRKKLLAIVLVVIVMLAAISIAAVIVLTRGPAIPTLASLVVIPNNVTLDIGASRTFQSRPMSTEGRLLQAGEVTVGWSIAPSGVGTLFPAAGLETQFNATAAGSAVITATATAGGVTKTATANVTVRPPPFWADHYTLAAPASVVQGDPVDVTVTVIDQLGSLLSSYRGTVHFTTTDTGVGVVLPADYTFTVLDAGTHVFAGAVRLSTPGAQTITARDAANATLTGSRQIQVIANQPPVADFTYAKTLLTLNADGSTSSDPDGTIVSYAWDWGDTTTGTGVTASHTYAAQGLYSVNLTVTDNRGATGLFQQLVSFLAPTADFSFTRTGYRLDVNGGLSSDADGTITGYAWTFGDGNTGTGALASHTYAGDGDYSVTLTVTDDDGFTGVRSQTAGFHSPVASFTLSQDNLTVSVDASASSDPDGTIVSYAWDWGDTTTDVGATAVHTYATKGTYTVALTVTDDIGLTGGANRPVTVLHRPIAAFTVSTAGLTVDVDGTGSSDPDGTVVNWAWDWGDTTTGTGATASHTYAAAGTYTVTLTVTDDDGLTDATGRSVSVGLGPQPPNIAFTLTIDGANFRLLADASASFDPDGTIVSYAWDWGDTTTGTGVTAIHSYATPGLYTVSLTITDNSALTNASSRGVSWFPPTARFTLTRAGLTIDVDGTGSTDPDGAIAGYAWDWGDGTPFGSGATASHTYAVGGTFTVVLNVTDSDGFWNRASRTIGFAAPTASFTLAQDLYAITVDASASFDPDGTIVSYAWAWGDTTSGAGVTAAHTYAAAGAYAVVLTVTDNDGIPASASRTVSANGTTYDFHYYDFFRVPYGEWWDVRTGVYGDLPIGADCFNATSIADTECVGTTSSQYPYTNWYPAPGNINPGNPNANPMLQTLYRFNVTGKNSPAYTIDTPVILPKFGPAGILGGSVQMDWYVQYMDRARALGLQADTPWNAIPGDNCGNIWAGKDGFIIEATLTMRMDYNTSRKIFGVSGNPTTWWTSQVAPGCLTYGAAETNYENWLVAQGGSQNTPGTYDIYSSFEWYYGPFFTDLVWQVTPNPLGGNTTTVTVHHGTWGYEVLMSRWFHYGRTTYADAVTLGTPPAGWWGMELAWFEDFRMNATISTDFDFYFSSHMGYHFVNVGLPGPDNTLGTNDDYSAWAWYPLLTDYIQHTGPKHPYSELDRYGAATYLHDSPGSRKYALQWVYDVVPHVWNLRAGETLTFHFPTTPITFYDPVASPRLSDPAALVSFPGVLTYDHTRPTGFGSWDGVTGTWSVWGPTNLPSPALPLYPDAAPAIWLRS